MTERPILFNGEMVPLVLDRTKTQTRRPVKYIPAVGDPENWCHRTDDPEFARIVGDYRRWCPFGIPGDRLWVRETWAPFYASGSTDLASPCAASEANAVCYKADGALVMMPRCPQIPGAEAMRPAGEHIWRPSIHMPRWASRITLEVTAVRVARVAVITTEEARAEGFGSVAAFMATWHAIYGPDVEWCWVVEFMRV